MGINRPVLAHRLADEGFADSDAAASSSEFLSALRELPLYRQSKWEHLLALAIDPVTRWLSFRKPPVDSHAVPQLTLWERFLCHQSRRERQMTFAVSHRDRTVIHNDFVTQAVEALCRFLVSQMQQKWQNQPLLVTVQDVCRSRCLDPRQMTGGLLRIKVVDSGKHACICDLDIRHAAQLSSSELHCYLQRQLSAAAATGGHSKNGAASVVISETPQTAEDIAGSYTDLPGAWLSIAPDRQTGGLVATADHLVLDGALFQQLLFDVARGCSTELKNVDTDTSIPQQPSARSSDPLVSLHVSELSSVCDLILHITNTLQEFGVKVHEGRDTVVLATIPQSGPDADQSIEKHRRRIMPLLLHVDSSDGPTELRSRINRLNESGWKSAGARAWSMIYRGNVSGPLVRYLERLAWYFPIQRTSRYLAGAALLTFVPPATVSDAEASAIRHLSVRTMKPICGGPTIAVSQVRGERREAVTTRIAISGSRHWNDLNRLEEFSEALTRRLRASGYQISSEILGMPERAVIPMTKNDSATTTDTSRDTARQIHRRGA